MVELPKNAVPLYRGLTEKSMLGFGGYADIPVGQIMKIDREYLVWVYYHVPKITFSSSILDELKITKRITKPGTDHEGFKEWLSAQSEGYTEEQRRNYIFARARHKKATLITKKHIAERQSTLSKGFLQKVNHGHYKLK